MLANLVSFIYVAVLAYGAFWVATLAFGNETSLERRSYLLVAGVNLAGFFLFGYWPFVIASSLLLLALGPREPTRRICVFFTLLPVMPTLGHSLDLAGFSLMYLNWQRLLTILLLVPVGLVALRGGSLFQCGVDKYVYGFVFVSAAMVFRDTTVTAGLRGCLYLVLDILVPYLVVSRLIRSKEELRSVTIAFIAGITFAGVVNLFETARSWHLYNVVERNISGHFGNRHEFRAGLLRAFGPMEKPSASAFALATGLGLLWTVSLDIRKRVGGLALSGIMIGGLLVTFSRGSWMAALIMGGAFLFSRDVRQFFRVAFVVLLVAVPLSFMEFGEKVVEVLPFLSDESSEAARTVEYREVLLGVALEVAKEDLYFGSTTFHQDPRLEALRQPNGLIDIVNHYLLVLLSQGLFGLVAFASVFLSVLRLLRKRARSIPDKDDDIRHYLNAMFWTLAGLLVAIFTTSAVGRVGTILWCLCGLGVAAAALAKTVEPLHQRPLSAALHYKS